MTIVAPPQPPPVYRSPAHETEEAVIKEARQRARRRRWISGAAVVVVAIAGVAAFATLRGTSPPHGTAADLPAPPPRPTPLGPPEVPGPDPGSTLLTSYAAIHDGYAFIFDDGRVIWHEDARGGFNDNATYERRLSPTGLDLVRSGTLGASDFVTDPATQLPRRRLPSDTWADAPAAPSTPWAPARYAGCPMEATWDGASYSLRDATSRLGELQTTAHALLHTRQIFRAAGLVKSDTAPSDCFALTPAEARAVLDLNGPNQWNWVTLIPASTGTGAIGLVVSPVLPHGATLGWGG